ncbi:MAG: hypothetical protein IPI36_12970 [Chitinophagaceae bacterium]|nr:hypothetical protein [Chitinophagaceae bacterium]
MKKIMAVAALVTLFIACNDSKNENKTETPAADSTAPVTTDTSSVATKMDSAVSNVVDAAQQTGKKW